VIAIGWLCAGCARPTAHLPDLPADDLAAEQRRQQIAQMRDYYGQLARVDNVAFHIRVANRNSCKRATPQIGLHAATARGLPRRYRSYAGEVLSMSWTVPTAISVAGNSPAALAGIAPGDHILTFDNTPLPPTGTDKWIARWLVRHGERPVQVLVRRDGVDTLRTVYPVMACAIPIRFVSNPTPNAYTDSTRIVIHSGILRVARDDAELALVIGHELAHVNMGHYKKKMWNALVGRIGGAAIDGGLLLGGIYTGQTFSRYFEKVGRRAFSVGFEREADYVGAYYAARAGYDISDTAKVWRAMALESPNSIRFATTHPTTPARFVQMQKAAAEIAEKKRQHLPLVPNIKVTQTQSLSAQASMDEY
jgi:hypothetical protein